MIARCLGKEQKWDNVLEINFCAKRINILKYYCIIWRCQRSIRSNLEQSDFVENRRVINALRPYIQYGSSFPSVRSRTIYEFDVCLELDTTLHMFEANSRSKVSTHKRTWLRMRNRSIICLCQVKHLFNTNLSRAYRAYTSTSSSLLEIIAAKCYNCVTNWYG